MRFKSKAYSTSSKSKLIPIITVVAISLLIIGMIGFPYWTADTVTFTVSEKERIMSRNSSKYLVFTESEVFENSDSLMRWKWGSSDLYGELKEGATYKADVYGWRIPFLSMYRNIVSVTKSEEK